MAINVRQGLFRLWVVLSIMFAVFAVAARHEIVSRGFAQERRIREQQLVPADCGQLRGVAGTDYRKNDPDTGCWLSLPKFRALYPEYSDLDDQNLKIKMYAKAPQTWLINPWSEILRGLVEVLGVVGITFVAGRATIWVVNGFRQLRA